MAVPTLAPDVRVSEAPASPPVRADNSLKVSRRVWPVVVAGLVFETLLIASFVPAPLVPLTSDSEMDELLPWLSALGQPLHAQMALLSRWIGLQPLAIILQVGTFLALFGPYAVVLRRVRHRSDGAIGKVVLAFGALFALTALGSRRLFSTDLFSYILNGRITVFYGANPYVDVPARYPQDPYVALVDWREVPNHYGPLWTFVSGAVAWIGGDQLGLTLFLFRLIPAVAAICVALVIWRLLGRWRPDQAVLGTALWAWNPLVVLESGGSGHNDAVLALCLVAAIAALVHRRHVLGVLAITAAVLVKYAAVVLAPVYMIVLLRRARTRTDRRGVAVGVLLGSALTVASFLPFWTGDGTLPATVYVSSAARYYNSPTEVLFTAARRWLGEEGRVMVERVEFRPWWAAVREPTDFFLERGRIPLGQFEAGHVVLATNRLDGEWQRVYDPIGRTDVYVALTALRTSPRPTEVAADSEVAAYELPAGASTVANSVNTVIRIVGWLIVLSVLGLLIYRSQTPDHLVRGWLLVLMLVYWFVATWFFPWYLIWGLAVAALHPRGPLVWALVVWSGAVFTYYGLAPLERVPVYYWMYDWRIVPMFLPPLLVLAWHVAWTRFGHNPLSLWERTHALRGISALRVLRARATPSHQNSRGPE